MLILGIENGKFEVSDETNAVTVIGTTSKELADFFTTNTDKLTGPDGSFGIATSSSIDFPEEYDFDGDADKVHAIVIDAFKMARNGGAK